MPESVTQEKDVGVIISENLKPSLQCAKAAQKECWFNSQRGLYQTYVRPHLEYAVAAWSPWTPGDKEILKAVQRRSVMMVTNLKGKNYSQRLEELGMTTLEERRERGT